MKLILFGVVAVLLHCVSSMSERLITCDRDKIYAGGDYLAFINYKCSENLHEINLTDDHPRYFDCENWNLTGLATRVYRINFENCKMSKIEYDYIKKYPNLVEFNVSFTGLEQLNKEIFKGGYIVKRFNASHNNISIIPSTLFLHAKRIAKVDLSYNKIKRFEPFALSGAKQLTQLDVSHNFLDHIEADYFDAALNLEHLILSHNNISEVASVAFKTLSKLKTLDLSFNNVTKLKKNMFDSLVNLQSLQLSHLSNATIEIEPLAFAGLNSLETLNLSQNYIASIKMGTFEGLTNVHTLTLNATKIKRIERLAFTGLNNITELDLSNNNSTITNSSTETMLFIDKQAFDNLTSLISLNLANNPVGNLSVVTFSKLINLQHLNLSNIQLSDIRFGLFSHLKNLQTLDLSRNRLKKFDFVHFLSGEMNLQQIYLNGNHLIELEGYKHYYFPTLGVVDITENWFNCSYLKQFLSESHFRPNGIKFSNTMPINPYEDIINGIRCVSSEAHGNELGSISITTATFATTTNFTTTTNFETTVTTPKSSTHENVELKQQNSFDACTKQMAKSLNDLHVLKILLISICAILTSILFIVLILIIVNRNRIFNNHRYADLLEQSQRQSSIEVSNF